MNILRKYADMWWALAWTAYAVTTAIAFCHWGLTYVFFQGFCGGVFALSALNAFVIARWGR